MTKRNDEHKGQLSSFDVSLERGFLPAHDPLLKIPRSWPDAWRQWGEIASELPKLLIAGQLRQHVEAMETASAQKLESKAELERAMLALSFIGHAYVWGEGSPPAALPKPLAVSWYGVGKKLGRPPVLSYASYALENWRRLDPKGPIALGNICLVQNFLGGVDEEWFILVHVDIEAKAGPALAALLPAQEAVTRQDALALEKELKIVENSCAQIYATLERMPERCDPYIYYNRVRPYIHGWKDHPHLPSGLLYTGVKEYGGKPQRFRGETGAQSSIIPALDAALGVVHEQDFMRHYLNEMRDYMPPKHRKFIETIEAGPAIREFVLEHGSAKKSLRDVYDQCIQWIAQFRTKHLEYASNYIYHQHELSAANPHAVGTGGTPFLPYLQKHRDETARHLINPGKDSTK
jgi:indoleamine 2,3-dioxygenase